MTKETEAPSLVLRPSRMPLTMACAGSLQAPMVKVERATKPGDPAEVGLAGHRLMADVARQDLGELPDLDPYIKEFGITDLDEFGYLAEQGFRLWREELRHHFPKPRAVEQRLGYIDPVTNLTLAGTPDITSVPGGAANAVDYKFGRVDGDFTEQMTSYAFLLWHQTHKDEVNIMEVLVRDGACRTWHFTASQLVVWWGRVCDHVLKWDGTFRVGGHCRFCPRQFDCPARQQMVRATILQLTDAVDVGDEIIPDDAISLYERCKVIGDLVDAFKDWCREWIRANGPLVGGNGLTLKLGSRNRDTIDPAKGWAVLREALTEDELAPAIKVGKTALLAAVAAKAPRGRKGANKAALMASLKAVGAVTTKQQEVLQVTRD